MIIIKKKYILLTLIVIFLAFLFMFGSKDTHNIVSKEYSIGEVKKVSVSDVEQSLNLSDLRAQRENVRKDIISKLNDTVNNAGADQKSRQLASEKINEIYDYSLKENVCEEMIKIKGFGDVLVYIDKDCVNVTVNSSKLTENDIIIIKDVIIDKTSINNIKIVAVE